MNLFATDRDRLAFLLETDTALDLDFETLEAQAKEAVTDETSLQICLSGTTEGGLLTGTCRFDRSHDHGENLICFILQIDQQFPFHQPCFNNQFHPIHTFVALFLNNSHFGNEFGVGASTAGSAVVGTNRRSAPEQLLSNHICRLILRQSFSQSNNPQGKSLCSVFEIFSIHGGNI